MVQDFHLHRPEVYPAGFRFVVRAREDWIKLAMGDNYVSADGQREGGSYRFKDSVNAKSMGKYSEQFARVRAKNRRAEMQQRLTETGLFLSGNVDEGAQRRMPTDQTEELPGSEDASRHSSPGDDSDSSSITTSTPKRQPVSLLEIASGSWSRMRRASTRARPSRSVLAQKPSAAIPDTEKKLRRSARLRERGSRKAI